MVCLIVHDFASLEILRDHDSGVHTYELSGFFFWKALRIFIHIADLLFSYLSALRRFYQSFNNIEKGAMIVV